jgi:type IX secretion system PorP/SprF family membrane protein
MRRLIHILCFVGLWAAANAQHSTLYSQYMFNGLLINPAYAGSNDVLNVTGLSRMQWAGFDGAPRTSTLSMHSPLKNKRLNLGLTFLNDRLGVSSQNKITAVFAYRIFFGKSSLAFGLQGGLNMIRNNWYNVHTTTAGDQVFTAPYSQQTIPDAGFGIYFKKADYFLGVSMPALFTFAEPGGINYKPALLTAGYLFTLSDNLRLKPSALVRYIKSSPWQFDLNLNVYYKAIGLGASYRSGDAMVFMANYGITQQFTAGYAYDLTISKLGTFVRGSHEIMLRYEFGFKVHPQSPRYF